MLLLVSCASSTVRLNPVATSVAPAPLHVVEKPSQNPAVVFRLLFRAGSADDPLGLEGLTALTARWMVEGGTRSLSSSELRDRLFPMAADIGVEVERDTMVVSGVVHRDHIGDYLPILFEVLLAPRWDVKEFERLRGDAENEVSRSLRLDDDEELGKQSLQALIYEGHPYGHPVEGTVQGLAAITPQHCQEQAKRVFSRERLVIGVGGGYSPEVILKLRDALAQLPEGKDRTPLPEPQKPRARVLLVEKDTDSTAISLGYPYPLLRNDPDIPALVVAASAFGEHRQFHGRLFQELRAKRGLNYGDYAYIESFVQEGWSRFARTNIARRQQHFSIWIRPVESKNRLFALRAALFQFDKLVRDGLSEEEVARTKEFLAGYTMLWSATDARRLGYELDDVFYGMGKPGYLEALRLALPRVTRDRVNAAIRRWLDPQRLSIAIVTRDAASLQEAMEQGKPSPIEYATPKPDEVLREDQAIASFPLTYAKQDFLIVPTSSLFEQAGLVP